MAGIDTPGLTNIASTILNLLGYKKVEDYNDSLITFTTNSNPKGFTDIMNLDLILKIYLLIFSQV